ncbi:MAG: WYL domain-containing protein, partial [Ilumatobacteraceae bacterium]|nr:WYL domain-containing protein [Ilumatobacteraceae bacterium]
MTGTSGQAERLKRVDPLERVLNLFTLLHRLTTPLTREQIVAQMARGMTPYPVAEAAQRQLFGSDKNTIVRDLGIPVRQSVAQGEEAGQTKYWISEEDMCIPEFDLTEEEMSVLSLALASIHQFVPEASEALMKLEGLSPQGRGVNFNVEIPLIVVRLTEIAQRRQLVEISIDSENIVVDPDRLLFDKGTWYLIATPVGEKKMRAIKCARIGADFSVTGNVSSAKRKKLSNRELRHLVHNVEGFDLEATVIVDALAAGMSWWDTRVVETESMSDGRLRITVVVDDPARFRGWVLGFGTHAVVEGPASLRDGFMTWLDDLLKPGADIPNLPERPSAAPT